jgi:fructose-1,6-bisphosphatase/inositol monophosphatase family enzyme
VHGVADPLAHALDQRYPGALILSEEACSANPGLLAGWSGADLAFVIDPVDGTYNFASGVPLFGVMLLVYLTSPNYISLLWTTHLGQFMLLCCVSWMTIGVLVMKKMINFDF